MKEDIKHADSGRCNFLYVRYLQKCFTQISIVLLFGDTLLVFSEGHQPGSQEQTETSVTKVCYGSVNSSLKELINISNTF